MSRDDGKEIVSVLRTALIRRIGQERYEVWFGDRVRVGVQDGALVVTAGQSFLLDQIRKSLRGELAATAAEVLGEGAAVEFRFDAMLAAPAKEAAAKNGTTTSSAGDDGGPANTTAPADSATPVSPAPTPAMPRKMKPASARPLRSRRFASLETFVVGEGNRLAHTAAQSLVARLGSVTPVFFHGPTGCGKTHLLEGIWSAARRQYPTGRILMLSAEQFTTFFLEALHGRGLPSFRHKYRDADLLLIDDVQFFVGKRATIVELHHTLDTFVRNGRQLVLAGDRPPAELAAGLGAELTARFSGGLVCGIDPLDRPTRHGILRQLAARSNAAIPAAALELLADRLDGDARALSGAVNRLLAASEALHQPVTAELAEQALGDIFQAAQRVVGIADVERAVCDVFGIQPETLHSSGKSRAVSQPRMLAMTLARKHTRAAYSEIGEHFGRRSHSTVIAAERKVQAWQKCGAPVQLAHGTCPVEDALRRIELRLRCG